MVRADPMASSGRHAVMHPVPSLWAADVWAWMWAWMGQASMQRSGRGAFRAGSPGYSQGQMHAGQWRPQPPPPHGPAMAWGVSCELSDSDMWEDLRAEVWGGYGRS